MMMRTLVYAMLSLPAAASTSAPLFFLPNHGQTSGHVRFMVKGSGLTAFFANSEVVLRTRDGVIRMQFPTAGGPSEIEALEPVPGVVNFLKGAQQEWRLGIPMYGGIRYRELYPGIDMIYGSNGRKLKSQFIVAPGSDPSRILVQYAGAGKLRIDPDGSLVVPVGRREIREEPPAIYQESNGKRISVEGQFALAGDAVGFMVGDYDRTLPLVIDPTVIYSTLLGGSNSDAAMALAVDASGAAYIAGFTASYDFPTANPEQNSNAGGNDVFVAKLNAAGTSLVYCTYVGGAGDDRAYGLAVDSTGAAYVGGATTSSNFPVRTPYQSKLAGGKDGFVLKLNPAGNSLVFNTYFGGNGSDVVNGLALDPNGSVYFTGDTNSATLPATGFQRSNRGGQDAFIAKLSSDGSRLLYATYLGGSLDDHAAAIAVDAAGSAYVTGSTWSSDFPVANAYQPKLGGGQDAFVARLDPAGSSLIFSTFLGGSGGSIGYPESANAIALDSQGAAYVTGVTSSTDFAVRNPWQSARRGAFDAFASKFSASGALAYSTYLGGSGFDAGNSIAADSGGNAYVAGQTTVLDLAVAFPSAAAGDYDAFVAELNASGSALLGCVYVSDVGADTATAIALDPSANVLMAGWTLSANFPVLGGIQGTNGGNYGAFITKLSFNASPPAPMSVTPSSGNGTAQTFDFVYSDNRGPSDIAWLLSLINGGLSGPGGCDVQVDPGYKNLWLLNDAATAWLGPVALGKAGTVQNSQCVVNGAASGIITNGNTTTLSLALTFQPWFAGAKSIYANAISTVGLSSGWMNLGTWTVPAAGQPLRAVSVTPPSGTGSTQTFSFNFTDSAGVADLQSLLALINSALSGSASCDVQVNVAYNALWLLNDAATGWLGPITLGTAQSVQNSQCAVNGKSSSLVIAANAVTLNLGVAFAPGFAGIKSVYGNAISATGLSSGWTALGAWTVPATSQLPQTVSVSPSSGSGSTQTFRFSYSDAAGASDLQALLALINAALSGPGSCDLQIDPAHRYLWLLNDAATAWIGPITMGTAGSVQNRQCTIDGVGSSIAVSGANVTADVAVTFHSGFTGTKNVYGNAIGASASSGWVWLGSWAVQ